MFYLNFSRCEDNNFQYYTLIIINNLQLKIAQRLCGALRLTLQDA